MGFIAIIGAAALPLAIAPGLLFFDDVTPKAVILLLLCAAALILTAWTPSGFIHFLRSREGAVFIALALAAAFTTLLSTYFAANRELAWYGSAWRRFGALQQIAVLALAAALGSACAASPSVRRWFIRGLCASGAIAGIYASLQYFGIDPLLETQAYHAGEGPFRIVRPPGTLGHSDYLGAFLLWSFFAGIAAAWTEQRPWFRVLGATAATASASGMMLTGARAPLLGAAAGLAVLVYLIRPNARTVAAWCAVLIIGMATFYVSPAGERLRARVFWAFDEPLGGARPLLWRDTASLVRDHPLTGAGPENFIAEFPRYQSEQLSRAFPDFYHESPHNFVLDAVAGQGIPGVLLLLAFSALGVWAGWRAYRARGDLASAALLAALAAAFVAHQFTVFTIPGAFCFFSVIALLAAPAGSGRPMRLPRRVRFAAVTVCGLGAIALAWAAAAFSIADARLAFARNAIESRDLPRAARTYNQAVLDPRASGGAHLYFSRKWAAAAAEAPDALSKMRYSHLANLAAARATAGAEQRANALYNYAAFAAVGNDAARTEASLRAAIEASPNWFKPHWTLARLLEGAGRIEEAKSEASRAAYLDGGKNAEVAETARRIGALP